MIALRSALALSLLLGSAGVAPADESAAAANQLLVAQSLDALTTRINTEHGWGEADPLMRGVRHSDIAEAVQVVVLNAAARLVFRHAPKVVRLLTSLEMPAVVNNSMYLARGLRTTAVVHCDPIDPRPGCAR